VGVGGGVGVEVEVVVGEITAGSAGRRGIGMYQDKDTGLYHFQGNELEDAMKWLWSELLSMSFIGRIELTWRIWTKNPPKWIGYKNPDYYRKKSLAVLNKMAGKTEVQDEGRSSEVGGSVF
jgi:hypothetical protein